MTDASTASPNVGAKNSLTTPWTKSTGMRGQERRQDRGPEHPARPREGPAGRDGPLDHATRRGRSWPGSGIRPTRRRARRTPAAPRPANSASAFGPMPSSNSAKPRSGLDHEQPPRRERERTDRPKDDQADVEGRATHVGARATQEVEARRQQPTRRDERDVRWRGAWRSRARRSAAPAELVGRYGRARRRRLGGRAIERRRDSGEFDAAGVAGTFTHGGSAAPERGAGSAASSSVTSLRLAASRPPP